MHEAMKKSQSELDNILTPEQKEKQQESRMTGWIKALTDPVELTDEQMKKLKAAYVELTKAADHEGMERKLPEVIQDVLTAGQKAAIARHRAMQYVKSMFARAKLTDEQMKSVETMIEAMIDELHKDPKSKVVMDWQSYNKLAEKIRGLLTAEQKKALEAPYTVGAPGASVSQLPGGGLRVIISEGGKDREALERRYKELSEKAGRLTEEAKRVKHEAYEVHEALERQPRQPQGPWQMLMPGQPLNVRPDPAIQELRSQVQELRRQVEELKAMVKKTAEKN
jgi:Spy/CpxP family protein refolding chaperone